MAKLQPRILPHDVLKLHTRTRTLVRVGALVLQMFQILCDVQSIPIFRIRGVRCGHQRLWQEHHRGGYLEH